MLVLAKAKGALENLHLELFGLQHQQEIQQFASRQDQSKILRPIARRVRE